MMTIIPLIIRRGLLQTTVSVATLVLQYPLQLPLNYKYELHMIYRETFTAHFHHSKSMYITAGGRKRGIAIAVSLSGLRNRAEGIEATESTCCLQSCPQDTSQQKLWHLQSSS